MPSLRTKRKLVDVLTGTRITGAAGTLVGMLALLIWWALPIGLTIVNLVVFVIVCVLPLLYVISKAFDWMERRLRADIAEEEHFFS